jgi:hypothetical protein
MKHLVGHTRNGKAVHVDLLYSEAAQHISRQPHLLDLVKTVLKAKEVKTSKIHIQYDMGRTIGYDFTVETTDTDTIFYAHQVREKTFTRFVKNGEADPTSYLTVTLRSDGPDAYELLDVWIGRYRPPLPGSENETSQSKSFWANHAVVLDRQVLQPHTLTKDCPY